MQNNTSSIQSYSTLPTVYGYQGTSILDINNIIVVPSNLRECCERTTMWEGGRTRIWGNTENLREREDENPRERQYHRTTMRKDKNPRERWESKNLRIWKDKNARERCKKMWIRESERMLRIWKSETMRGRKDENVTITKITRITRIWG